MNKQSDTTKKLKPLVLRMPPQLHHDARVEAAHEDKNLTKFINDLVAQYVEQKKKQHAGAGH